MVVVADDELRRFIVTARRRRWNGRPQQIAKGYFSPSDLLPTQVDGRVS